MLYKVIRQLFAWIFQIFYRWDVQGRENLPDEGAFLLCANHISWWDPPLMGAVTSRTVRFMAKEELFKIPVFGKILPKVNAFPVKRDSADRRAIKTALDTLKSGGVVGIFPEGTRSKTDDLLPPQAGVGLIAVKSEAPVVPAAIVGPYKLFRPIQVRIGKPMTFPQHYGTRVKAEHLEDTAQKIMEEIGRLRKV
ncbi:lysophospholipid acyltransferase family protein [Dethiobacter alkaliphilus]|uniref:1-acyl-sn-glycerol-3-phosphate acyltransferase n=1 Tax=Dethiobacter alkaliphilus AHT 1 TaxID=555088 RepID=C0GDV1_DETAL|nr:lysophospholipid acyltransferase family protein [Dethiobacter alkaliphilus]EEG78245.1 1-acyl-sn-glycerol-3-phosphate acyltransferase [Dethiobacter alkaliphilus AHT 1]